MLFNVVPETLSSNAPTVLHCFQHWVGRFAVMHAVGGKEHPIDLE